MRTHNICFYGEIYGNLSLNHDKIPLYFCFFKTDEQDMKSWEMVNQEDVDDVEETEEREVIEEVVDAEDDNNSALDGVVRRRRHPEVFIHIICLLIHSFRT